MEDLLPESAEISKESLEQAVCRASYDRSAHADEASASEVCVPAGPSPPK